MHLWGTTSQQVNERRVEGHDSIAHVNNLLLIVTISGPNSNKGEKLGMNSNRKEEEHFLKAIAEKMQGKVIKKKNISEKG